MTTGQVAAVMLLQNRELLMHFVYTIQVSKAAETREQNACSLFFGPHYLPESIGFTVYCVSSRRWLAEENMLHTEEN